MNESLVLRVTNITSEAIHIAKDKQLAFLTDGVFIDLHESDLLHWNDMPSQNGDITIGSEPVWPYHVKPLLLDTLPNYISVNFTFGPGDD